MSIHDGRSILLFSSGASLALVWAEVRSFWGHVVSYFALLRRFSNPSHFADRCFQVLCHLMNAAHCTWKDLHSLQIHAANIEWKPLCLFIAPKCVKSQNQLPFHTMKRPSQLANSCSKHWVDYLRALYCLFSKPQFSCTLYTIQCNTMQCKPQFSCSAGSPRSSIAATGCIQIHQTPQWYILLLYYTVEWDKSHPKISKRSGAGWILRLYLYSGFLTTPYVIVWNEGG